ncbi:ABC transporter substrate-binding protein [Zhihengliuella salsuginis]|uniref:Sugar ABC transporter substrate-binding protein n=1 Tax=Zhihengliuella salsuginis TaxID=578222 RepID=A0ABQ3GI55_9MICC|nr:ABC transporter substrate-binding protein [Zhihengliuella salsuginis]GHD06931.1 sugar ABC transporter substrate-binding protein [Zhihengliuella salsuginis]
MSATLATPGAEHTEKVGNMKFKRLAQAAAITAVSAVALTACGGDGGSEGEGGDVSLRFTWWGSDARAQITEEIIAEFEAENPNIDIQPEYSDWTGYWDKLATQTAANDAPDIIQMDAQYLREYADRGALLDLSGVDVSQIEDQVVANGRTEEGLFGITTGINTPIILANPDVFAEAGVEMPDDTTWTWDDFSSIAQEISESGDGIYGSGAPAEPLNIQVWLRQQGTNLTTEDGQLGVTEAQAEEYLQHLLDLSQSGAYPQASAIAEDQTAAVDQSLVGTGAAAMGTYWSNQLSAIGGASGADVVPLRYPSQTGDSADAGLWYKASMMLSASAGSDHPEEAQQFIDYFVNNVDAGLIGMTERGLPANTEVRAAVAEELEGTDKASAEFVEEVEPELGEAEPVPPVGFSEMQDILGRYELEVYFERQSPADAAKSMIAELEAVLG